MVAYASKVLLDEPAEKESAHSASRFHAEVSSSSVSRDITCSPSTSSPASSDASRSVIACCNASLSLISISGETSIAIIDSSFQASRVQFGRVLPVNIDVSFDGELVGRDG